VAARFIDSWAHYATADILQKWTARSGTSNSIVAGAGRGGGGCFRTGTTASNYLSKTLDAQATWVVGFAFKPASAPSSTATILQFLDTATVHAELRMNTDGTLGVARNGTVLATSTNALTAATWYYVEIKVTIADSGTYEVRVNGTSTGWIPSATGDTRNAGNASANVIRLGATTGVAINADIGDLYVLDGTDGTAAQGAANNDFLGDVAVTALRPTGAGSSTQFTPSAGANWECMDDTSADGDTTYVESSTAGHVDLYAMGNLTASAPAKFIQVVHQWRKTDAGTRTARPVVKSGSSTANGSTISLSDSFTMDHQIIGKDPATGAVWTNTAINAIEAGLEVIS
jgi:hypothetical protein